MPSRLYPPRPLIGVCTALYCGEKVLLVQRSQPPSQGLWALPGGLVELGERLEDAARRETLEETGILPETLAFSHVIEIIRRDDHDRVERHYVLSFFAGQCRQQAVRAGDDAQEARWATVAELRTLPMIENSVVNIERALQVL